MPSSPAITTSAPAITQSTGTPPVPLVIDKVAAPLANAGLDWDGQPRPAGITDLGADEYGATGGTVPPAPQNLRIIR